MYTIVLMLSITVVNRISETAGVVEPARPALRLRSAMRVARISRMKWEMRMENILHREAVNVRNTQSDWVRMFGWTDAFSI